MLMKKVLIPDRRMPINSDKREDRPDAIATVTNVLPGSGIPKPVCSTSRRWHGRRRWSWLSFSEPLQRIYPFSLASP